MLYQSRRCIRRCPTTINICPMSTLVCLKVRTSSRTMQQQQQQQQQRRPTLSGSNRTIKATSLNNSLRSMTTQNIKTRPRTKRQFLTINTPTLCPTCNLRTPRAGRTNKWRAIRYINITATNTHTCPSAHPNRPRPHRQPQRRRPKTRTNLKRANKRRSCKVNIPT